MLCYTRIYSNILSFERRLQHLKTSEGAPGLGAIKALDARL